jgi:hypothetical protein
MLEQSTVAGSSIGQVAIGKCLGRPALAHSRGAVLDRGVARWFANEPGMLVSSS